ncbi:unnamed protein product [Closterium sp. NIES-53]
MAVPRPTAAAVADLPALQQLQSRPCPTQQQLPSRPCPTLQQPPSRAAPPCSSCRRGPAPSCSSCRRGPDPPCSSCRRGPALRCSSCRRGPRPRRRCRRAPALPTTGEHCPARAAPAVTAATTATVAPAATGATAAPAATAAPGVARCSSRAVLLQRRPREALSPQQLREWYAQSRGSLSPARCPYVIRTGVRTGAGEAAALGACTSPAPRAGEAAALGACTSLAPRAGEATALGAGESTAPGTGESALSGVAPAAVLHTFTLDSGASRSFFRDSTTLTPLSRPAAVSLADPSRGPLLAHSSTVLPSPVAPSGLLSGLHLPSFSTNLVSGADLQHAWVDQFTPGGQRVTHCTCFRTGRHLATFTRRPGSSLYTLTIAPPPVSASGKVAASSQVFAAASRSSPASAPCSCLPLAHETLLWHHRLGHPSLPRLRGMASRALVSGLPRSLPPLPPEPAPTCIPCVEGRQRAAPHASSFPPTEAPLQTLHMDVWGPARVRGQGHERYFLLVVDDYLRYTTVFPLRSNREVPEMLIDWICGARRQLSEIFGSDLPVLRLHSDMGGEFSSDLLRAFCRSEGRRHTFTLLPSLQQNGIAERRIGMVMDVARTSMIHAAAPHFLWPFAVQYTAHQINLQPRVSLPETTPTLRWTGKVGDASAFRVWGSRAFFRDTTADKLSSRAVPCVFLGFPPDAPGWRFYHPTSHRVDPAEPVMVAVNSGATRGAEHAGAVTGGAGTGGAEPGRVEPGGAESGGAESGRAEPGVLSLGVWSLRVLCLEWYSLRCRGAAGAGAAGGAAGAGAAGGAAGDGAARAAGGAAGARAVGGAAGTGAAGGAAGAGAAGGAAGAGAAGGAAGAGAARGAAVTGNPWAEGTGSVSAPDSPQPHPSPLSGPTRGFTKRREPESRPVLPESRSAVSLCCFLLRPLFLQVRTLRLTPYVLLVHLSRVFWPLLSLTLCCICSCYCYCRLDYATSLVAMSASASVCPLFVGGECALGTEALEDRQEEFECFAASVPHLVSMLIAPEGDPDALDIPTPRSYAEAIEGPYSSQWQADMDAEMASWKSTGTYVDEVPRPRANIISGMWIFRVKRPPGSPPVFEARYIARGFSQGQGVEFFQTFSPTPKMTTLRVLLHVAAQRDYELHSLDFSTAFLQGSLHEEIWLRRPPGFTGSMTLAALGFAPSTSDPSLFLRTNTTLPPFYVLVYVDVLVFATADTDALAHVKQEDLECFAAASPHLVSMLLAPEGDPDALNIPTPRSYAEAIEGPYSSQWQAAIDAEMASWKSTGTYVDEVPPPGANIVSGMWIFRVKRPPSSPPAFNARYVARGFSQRQGVDFFQTYSPTSKMTTLRVLLHVAAQRDYEPHSLDFSTAFLQGSLHEEIWLRRPPGFTGSFPPGTQWSLRRPVYGLRQAPREWHDTVRTTLAALGFALSTADPSLFLRTNATLPSFYVLMYVDDLVFATAGTEALAHVKAQRTITLTQSHMVQQVLQRFGFTYSSPQSTLLPIGLSLSAPPSDESVEPSGLYQELVGCLITSGMGLVLGGRAQVVLTGHADTSWVDDLATQRSLQGYTFSLGSGSVSWRSTRSSSVLSSSCEAEVYVEPCLHRSFAGLPTC